MASTYILESFKYSTVKSFGEIYNGMSQHSVEFDQRGDLKLRVGPPNETTSNSFLVCSRTLARVSPVFDRILYGSSAEAKPADAEGWVVDLPRPDQSKWNIIVAGPNQGNQEVQDYTNSTSNSSLSGSGALHITPQHGDRLRYWPSGQICACYKRN